MRKIIERIVIAVFTIVLFLSGQQVRAVGGEEQQEIKVGYIPYDRMIKQDEEGNFYGYGVSYLEELAKLTGWRFRYIQIEEGEYGEKLLNGEIDLVCSVHKDHGENTQLIFSEDMSGLEYAMLCAREDNNEIFFQDYEAINGKRIGINRNSDMEQSLKEYAQENNFAYEIVYFNEFEEMQDALNSGEIDIMVASSLRSLENVKYVGKAQPQKEYFAVGQQNQELMNQLNAADEQLKRERPFFISSLYERFYGQPYRELTGITREEYEFIQEGTVLRVACDENKAPMEYRDKETGQYKGIYVDILKLISEEYGLNFEFVPVEEDVWSQIEEGRADLLPGVYGGAYLQKMHGVLYTQNYLTSEYVLIENIDYEKDALETPVLAVPRGYLVIQDYFAEQEPEWKQVLYDDVGACLEAVNSGDADFTAVNPFFLEGTYNIDNYKQLKVIHNMDRNIPISIGVSGENARVLQSILNKAIYEITDEKIQKSITDNIANISYTPTISELLRRFAVHISLIVVGAAAVVIYIISRREKHYRHLAMTDSVTGLWNRVKFYQEAKEILEKRDGKTYLLISLDINKFKFINNDFGTRVGDDILRTMGHRIRENVKDRGWYARNTADVFLILMEKENYSDELLKNLSQDIRFENKGKMQNYRIAVKAGIRVILPEEERTDITLYVDQASLARKTVKDKVNEDVAYYDEAMKESIAHELAIENKMENALKNREFQVYLQPKYNLKTESISGAEALVRWIEPESGMIPPDKFIPLFEKNGFILNLDFYVYEEVMRRMAEWREQGKEPICVSVNVSRVHVGTPDFFEKLNRLIEKYGISKQYFELELTETIMGGAHSRTRMFIQECKKEGYQVSIDDFGSGYSSLNLLKDFPVDILKIDKAFLDEIEDSVRNSIIVQQVVEMAKKMNICTLCEGVETVKQAAFLKQIGCDMAQGYLFSRPIPMDEFEKLI